MGVIRDRIRKRRGKKDKEDGEDIGILGTLIPFWHFDMMSTESRRGYIENLFDKFGGVLSFLPFILIMAIACSQLTVAIWTAFGVNTFLILCGIYRSRYNKFVPFVKLFDLGLWVGFLAQGITVSVVKDVSCDLVSPINVSILLAITVVSMIVCYPFTIQYSKAHVSEEVAASKGFLIFNQFMAGYWCVIFVIMCTTSWCAYFFYRDDKSSAGWIVLSTVIPIVLPILGGLFQPFLVDYLQSTRNGLGDDKEVAKEKGDEESAPLMVS